MRIIVSGRNMHVSSHLRDHAIHKLERVGRFGDRIQALEIEFSEEHNPRIAAKFTVEVTATTKQQVIRAHASGPDAMSAVDLVEDKLEAQVNKLRSRFTRRGSRTKHPKMPESPASSEPGPATSSNGQASPVQSEPGSEASPEGPQITHVTRFTVKPMTAEEAVLQMETLGHDFYLFVDAESEQAGVVYRRRDGSFGLIEPD
ncbi:MAG TPA: ribosome-associated translation inhibitor RaiA [Actinomycetota bacterium]